MVVIAASLFVRELGAAPDPIEATQRWLAGEESARTRSRIRT
jgi:hypothetical protein